MKFGRWEVTSVLSGFFRLDGGAMFGSVPKALWDRTNPADDRNRIDLALRCMLIRGMDRTILVDVGIGDKFSEKESSIYAVDRSRHTLQGALEAQGVPPDDVTDVVLTHLHFDHAGGVSRVDPDGNLRLAFPNARHWLQKSNLETAMRPNEREKASYLKENWAPVKEAPRLSLLDGPEEIYPGIRLLLSEGHTAGLQMPRVEGDGRWIQYCADMIPTASHVRIPYVMGYDLCPRTLMEEKRRTAIEAVRDGGYLFFEHDPWTPASRVTESNARFDAGLPERLGEPEGAAPRPAPGRKG